MIKMKVTKRLLLTILLMNFPRIIDYLIWVTQRQLNYYAYCSGSSYITLLNICHDLF